MIGRRAQRKSEDIEVEKPKGFDDFEVSLGDMMRGERATMGKSLLDVQRELRIKANYIAAIENSDPTAFDTPGFIAGYVRSYARYLGMNPDEAFATFCAESGFEVAHGMSAEASSIRKPGPDLISKGTKSSDPFMTPNTPFVPAGESFLNHIEPRAIGSTLVLLALIGGIGYGGWSVLKEVQQVQFAPVEQTPVVLSDLDPLDQATQQATPTTANAGLTQPTADALDRLYRPQALDVPVLVSRDAPISTLDPRTLGNFTAPALPDVQLAQVLPTQDTPGQSVPQVVENLAPSLTMVAVRPSWVRVTAADGTHIYETIMEPGSTYQVPLTEEAPTLHAGESSGIYFIVNGEHRGPVGDRGVVTRGVVLSPDAVEERYLVAEIPDEDQVMLNKVAEALTSSAAASETDE
ncbi:helix-turn-helix domain-containing protein [Falsiruegeria mediterranea]|uniref:Cytoskeleton protein RodZ n=1 Tax=Falsiruegeria mediterranea M17 TaxID=1200281 RepID=A0A2R8CF31_9RHOB|nr:helix-turn-helix domain-containing protein [Falsiruegeria mediterranea]SPJ31010.1 Cytoskeleton protein RodZ [Falsiruegeria mediterranea M17]